MAVNDSCDREAVKRLPPCNTLSKAYALAKRKKEGGQGCHTVEMALETGPSGHPPLIIRQAGPSLLRILSSMIVVSMYAIPDGNELTGNRLKKKQITAERTSILFFFLLFQRRRVCCF